MSSLSNMAETIAETIRETFRADAEIAVDIPVLVEDKLDTDYEILAALDKLGLSVIVGVGEYRRMDGSGRALLGEETIVVEICETPAVSRASSGFITAQSLAEKLMRSLHWVKPEGWLAPLVFQSFARADAGETIRIIMNFKTCAQLTTNN